MVGLSAYICDQTLRTVIMMLSSVHRRWWQDHHGYDHDSRQEQDLAERRQMGDGVFLAVADLSCVWMWGWLVSCPCLYIEAVGGWSKLGRKLSPHHYFILQLLLQEIKLSPFIPFSNCCYRKLNSRHFILQLLLYIFFLLQRIDWI